MPEIDPYKFIIGVEFELFAANKEEAEEYLRQDFRDIGIEDHEYDIKYISPSGFKSIKDTK